MTNDMVPMTDENSVQVYKSDLENFILCAFRYLDSRRNDVLINALPQIERYWEYINKHHQDSIKFALHERVRQEWPTRDHCESERKYIEEFLKK